MEKKKILPHMLIFLSITERKKSNYISLPLLKINETAGKKKIHKESVNDKLHILN